MVLKDDLDFYSCTHADICRSPASYLSNDMQANDIPFPLLPLCEVETNLINNYEHMGQSR